MEINTIYTDGSSRGNPGPGGWGAIIIGDHKVREIGGRVEKTTNNRMEMTAVIEALKTLREDASAEVHTDSEYLLKGITEWVYKWQANGWKTKDKKEVLNQDLWEHLIKEVEKRNTNGYISWEKVQGHSGHKFNDRCDEIATGFADGKRVGLFNGLKKEYKV